MNKSSKTISALVIIAAIAVGAYLYFTPQDSFEISLSPNPGRYTANDTVTIEVSTTNQGYELQSGTATFKFDPQYLTLQNIETENGITSEKTDSTFTINFDQTNLNSSATKKAATLTFSSAVAGVTSIELTGSSFKDEDNKDITPSFTTGRYAFNTTITPEGESEY